MSNRHGLTTTNRAGFTLLELLMVVIIIAILASIALPQYLRVAERSRASEALSMLAAMRSAELRFKAQDPGNAYTPTVGNLDTDVPPSTMWVYTLDATHAIATRAAGGPAGIIWIVLDSGVLCSNNATYGLAPVGC